MVYVLRTQSTTKNAIWSTHALFSLVVCRRAWGRGQHTTDCSPAPSLPHIPSLPCLSLSGWHWGVEGSSPLLRRVSKSPPTTAPPKGQPDSIPTHIKVFDGTLSQGPAVW